MQRIVGVLPAVLLVVGLIGPTASAKPAVAALPEMAAFADPAPVEVTVVAGEVTLHPGSTEASGLATFGASVDQTLGWGPAAGPIEDAAAHEVRLVTRALEAEGASPSGAESRGEIDVGSGGRAWFVDGGATVFVGAVFDCPGHRVTLATFGPQRDVVERVHAASLVSVRCRGASSAVVQPRTEGGRRTGEPRRPPHPCDGLDRASCDDTRGCTWGIIPACPECKGGSEGCKPGPPR